MPEVAPYTPAELAATRASLDRIAGAVAIAPGTEVAETVVGGRPALRVTPATGGARGTLLLVHGGGYRAGSPAADRGVASHLAAFADIEVVLPSYRLAPEHPAPAARDDVRAALDHLLDRDGVPPGRLAVGGLSAGGGLALAATLAALADGRPAPAALVLLSPWVDLDVRAASYERNAATDPILDRDDARRGARAYLGPLDPRDPAASPLHADPGAFARLPPTLVQASTAEVLHDDAAALTARIRDAGGEATLQTWDDVLHCWHVRAPEQPESTAALRSVSEFLVSRYE